MSPAMDELERKAQQLYEADTHGPGTAYTWSMLVALSRKDRLTAEMVERYRAKARKLQQ